MTARSSDANDDDNDNDAAAHRSSSSSISISSSETKEQQHEHSMTETETETTERSQVEAAVSLCRQARTLWLRNATAADDLDRVEELYRKALNSKRGSGIRNKNKNKRKRISPTDNFTTTLVAALPPEEYRKAGERLSLLYLQSGRAYKAKAGLKYLGFECRLSERILNYPLSNRFIPVPPTATATATAYKVGKSGKGNKNKNKNNNNMPKPPCCVVDDFLSESELRHLRKVFGDVNSSYWSSHNYIIDEEPPAPYFSYVIDLKSKSKSSNNNNNNNNNKTANTERGILRTIVDKILRCGPVVAETDTFRNLRREANYVELWAHNRPHASGHQLHFDSDDEGRSRHNGEGYFPKHPIASTVLNLSSHARVGGPTLVTTQRLRNPATTHLSSVKGWLVPSKPGRLVVFDGSVLHGVIPGKGTIPPPMDNDNDNDEKEHRPRRVTLMMAFWKDIEVRTGSKPGSARPWPSASSSSSTLPPWAVELNRTDVAATCESSKSKHRWKDDTEKSVIPVKHVYELLDGTPVPKYYDNAEDGGGGGDGPYMPEYDRVFQGF